MQACGSHRTPLVVCAGLLLALGCRSAPAISNSHPAAPAPPTGHVHKMLVLWTDSVLHQDHQPIAQGLVGTVYLVSPDSKEPVAAAGTFKFYGYLESSPGGTQKVQPDREWSFGEHEARALLRKDALGWGYSFWLPWGPPADQDRSCTLFVRFTPAQGSPIVSEPNLITLSGLKASRVRGTAKRVERPAGEIQRL